MSRLLNWLVCMFLACAAAAEPAKEIYGTDDRLEAFQIADPAIRHMSRAVCALVSSQHLLKNPDGSYTILSEPNVYPGPDGEDIGLCPGEPFASQPYAAYCTAFLVAPDVIATAGHCAVNHELGSVRALFGWEMLDADTPVQVVAEDHVYRIAATLDAAFNNVFDHALLRLDRAVTLPGVQPLPVRQSGRIADASRLGVIGHPFGLPLKVAFGAQTRVYNNFWPLEFTCNIDASAGNSGSPVINQDTGVVEGIYITSLVPDLLLDGDCLRLNRVGDEAADQGVTRSTNFAAAIPGYEPKFLSVCGCGPGGKRGGWQGDMTVMLATLGALALYAGATRRAARNG